MLKRELIYTVDLRQSNGGMTLEELAKVLEDSNQLTMSRWTRPTIITTDKGQIRKLTLKG